MATTDLDQLLACPDRQPADWLVVLDAALARLSARDRDPILLCDLLGRSRAEAAAGPREATRGPAGISARLTLDPALQRAAERLLARSGARTMLVDETRPGVTTERIDRLVFDFAMAHNAMPATLMYRGYRKSTCTSINHVVCHGIPG